VKGDGMPSFYSCSGDDGTTGLLGEGRIAKFDLLPETLGTLDEANAAIGLSRVHCIRSESNALLIAIQRHLYGIMSEVAATPENASLFHKIGKSQVEWLESQISKLENEVKIPSEFILPGDSLSGAALDLARTIVRRAERRMAELLNRGDISNLDLLRYLNRLSSLLFVLELSENQAAGKEKPTLAKG
jgi:cob(I)alamin adenosyltransferase